MAWKGFTQKNVKECYPCEKTINMVMATKSTNMITVQHSQLPQQPKKGGDEGIPSFWKNDFRCLQMSV